MTLLEVAEKYDLIIIQCRQRMESRWMLSAYDELFVGPDFDDFDAEEVDGCLARRRGLHLMLVGDGA